MRFKVHYRVMKERKIEKKARKKKTRSLKSLEKKENGITQTVGSDKTC